MRTPTALLIVAISLASGGCEGGPTGSGSGSVRWTQVAVGATHTCARADDGKVYCWGRNTEGQLGRSDRNGFRPERVEEDGRWMRVVAGRYTSCGYHEGGAIACWGLLNSDIPARAAGGPAFSTLSLGTMHLCGLAAEGGAYCWGSNQYGQLGVGLIGNTGYSDRPAPTAVAGGARYRSIATGDRVTCALSAEGQPLCWGVGYTNGLAATPRPVDDVTARFDTLVMGSGSGADHECGLTAAREIFCWGESRDGQAGVTPTRGNRAPATRIVLPGGAAPVAITAGGDETDAYTGHSCALTAAARPSAGGATATASWGMAPPPRVRNPGR